MRQAYQSGAVTSAPSETLASSVGFPANEDIPNNVAATIPGPYIFHAICTEIETVIIEGGLVPETATLTQLRDAIAAIVEAAIAAINLPDGVALASNNEHLANNPPANKAATPAGVRAVRNALQATIEGGAASTRDTLQELYTVLNAAIALRLLRTGGTMTGALNLETPAANDDSKKAVPSEWVKAAIEEALQGMNRQLFNSNAGVVFPIGSYVTVALTTPLSEITYIRLFGTSQSAAVRSVWIHKGAIGTTEATQVTSEIVPESGSNDFEVYRTGENTLHIQLNGFTLYGIIGF